MKMKVPPDANELMFSIFVASLCDVLASFLAETRVLVEGLERKDVLSVAEQQQAVKELPRDRITKLAEQIREKLMKRMLEHSQAITGGGSESIQ